MAFQLYIDVNGTITYLSDGNPFRVESIREASGADVRRLRQAGPLAQGEVDLGYRLHPRTLTLQLLFVATSDAALDGYRDTLVSAFKPVTGFEIELHLERDDGTTRVLTCQTIEQIEIDPVTEHRPGHLHRATITLRAANPLWAASSTTSGTVSTATNQYWWRAGTAIGSANVMEVTYLPSQGQSWTYTGTITGEWSILVRTGQEVAGGTKAMFHAGTTTLFETHADARFFYKQNEPNAGFRIDEVSGSVSAMPSGTQNYMFVLYHDGFFPQLFSYYGGTTSLITAVYSADFNIAGTARRWRSDRLGSVSSYWTNELEKVAVYNVALTQAQRVALDAWMNSTAVLGSVNVVNSGDVNAYPYITITGPITNPKLVNSTTGQTLDLSGVTVGSAQTFTLDLRTGDKQTGGAQNYLQQLTSPIALANWHLAPAPVAAGGTNTIVVYGGGTFATTSKVVVEHTNQYMSF